MQSATRIWNNRCIQMIFKSRISHIEGVLSADAVRDGVLFPSAEGPLSAHAQLRCGGFVLLNGGYIVSVL